MLLDQLGTCIDVLTLSSANDDVLSRTQGLAVMGAIFTLSGVLILLWRSRDPLRRTRQFLGAEPYDPLAPAVEEPVSARGAVDRLDETVSTPLTGTKCVAYEFVHQVFTEDWRYDAERRSEMRRNSTSSDEEAEERIIAWHTVSAEADAVPFALRTGDATVVVDPAGADLDMPVRTVEQSSWPRRALHRVTTIAQFGQLLGTSPERRIERHVGPGDTVLVVGEVEKLDERIDEAADAAGRFADGADPFVISTRSKRSLVLENLKRTIGASVPGAAFLAVGFVFFLGAVATAGFL